MLPVLASRARTFCPGSSLARLELTVMFERLLARLPDLEPTQQEEPGYRPANFISGYESLPVRYSPGPAAWRHRCGQARPRRLRCCPACSRPGR